MVVFKLVENHPFRRQISTHCLFLAAHDRRIGHVCYSTRAGVRLTRAIARFSSRAIARFSSRVSSGKAGID